MKKSFDGIVRVVMKGGTQKELVKDYKKRYFLKAIGVAGMFAFAYSLFPKKAQALIFGSGSRSPDPVGLKNSGGTTINPATEEKQNSIITNISSLNTVTTGQLTLTSSNTAYLLPATELSSRRSIALYNGSDTDMYIGNSGVTTFNGILLPSGGSMNLDVSSGLYAVCGTAGKVINILEMK